MATQRFLICPKRAGRPKVALEICQACAKRLKCPAWRDWVAPPLFPELRHDHGGGRSR